MTGTLLLALVATQASSATVGDTIWLHREAPIAPGQVARLPEWELTGDIESLGPPRMTVDGGTISVAFPVVAWRPGEHLVTLPGPIIIDVDGSETALAADSRRITVSSVLPVVPPDSLLPIKPEAGLVTRPVTSILPLLALWAFAALLLSPLWWWWRRRGQPVPVPAAAAPVQPDIEAWAEAGETRAVLGASVHRLREALEAIDSDTLPGISDEAWAARLAELKPDAPLDGVTQVAQVLKRLRFAPHEPAEALLWYRKAVALAETIEQQDQSTEGAAP